MEPDTIVSGDDSFVARGGDRGVHILCIAPYSVVLDSQVMVGSDALTAVKGFFSRYSSLLAWGGIGMVCMVAGSMLGHTETSGDEYGGNAPSFSHSEAGFSTIQHDVDSLDQHGRYSEEDLEGWKRPPGVPRIGIQAGHLHVEDAPDELTKLKKNGAGAVVGTTTERDTVLPIAERVVELLKLEGIRAEVLPVTIPPGYEADAVVSIHADANSDPRVSGFKLAAPHGDRSGFSNELVTALYDSYEIATGLSRDPAITRHMTGYYAFNWRRYEHAIHPMTPAAILEVGYLTNDEDRRMMLEEVDRIALGIVEGILAYLRVSFDRR